MDSVVVVQISSPSCECMKGTRTAKRNKTFRNFFISTLLELVEVKLLIKEKKNTLKRK
jgi:hypothetical protein